MFESIGRRENIFHLCQSAGNRWQNKNHDKERTITCQSSIFNTMNSLARIICFFPHIFDEETGHLREKEKRVFLFNDPLGMLE